MANFIVPPDLLAKRVVQYAEYLKNTPGVQFGITQVDKSMIPAKPGELIAFIARPGHGKSSMMSAIAINHAKHIASLKQGTTGIDKAGRAVLYVSWEQLVETQALGNMAVIPGEQKLNITDIHWGRANLDELKRRATKLPHLPLWIAGTSHAELGKPRDRMYIDALFENIVETYHKYDIKFDLVCLDYLQLIPVQRGRSRSEEVSEAVKSAKYLAQELGAPVLIGVQAKKEVDGRDDKIPTMGDAYYTSELDHDADKGFGIMRPAKYQAVGSVYELPSKNGPQRIPVTNQFTLMRMWKQRGDVGNCNFAFNFDIPTMTLTDLNPNQNRQLP